jgi:S1-C subfamily serine protease
VKNAINFPKIMTKIFHMILAALLAGFFTIPTRAAEDALITQAKKVFAEQQDSVIWISVVAKISLQAEGGKEAVNIPDREQKNETLGTFIDSTGLAVTALSSIDPSREYNGREVRTRDGVVKIEANVVLKEVRVTMPDGTEIPADVVMRDVDLDLAFLRIKSGAKEAKGVSFKSVDLKNAATVNVSDDIITISRNDEVMNRVASVSRGQITSVTKKPREFLRATGANLGCPTFTPDGKLVGIAVNRTVRGKSSQTVLIPAADVLEIAEQARAAKPAPAVEEKPKKSEDKPEEK